MPKIAFIGLGTMGYPMAGHLARQGNSVTVFNRTASRSEEWCREYGGMPTSTAAAAVKEADIVLTCVGNDNDLRQVILEKDGVVEGLKPGALLVDHTTVSAALARELATRLESHHVEFIDAPVSGGQQGAINGQLAIMCGGSSDALERARPVMNCYARAITHMGPVGTGQLTKMVNQICVAGLVEALAEGMYFAEKAGLDVQSVIDVISQGAASSWQMVNRHKTMIAGNYDHGFAVDWMRKDLAICLTEASRLGIELPVTAQVNNRYALVQEMGGGRWDTSSLLALLKSGR